MEQKYLEGTKIEDLIGMRFNYWTVLEFNWEKYKKDKIKDINQAKTCWVCRCECGTIMSIDTYSLKNNKRILCKKCAYETNGYKIAKTRLINGKSFYDWCIENEHQDWLDLWDYDMNTLKPREIGFGSGRKIYFKCPKNNHESEQTSIGLLTSNKSNLNCRKCGSFGQYLLDEYGEFGIEKYWSNKNTLYPFEVYKSSNVNRIWIKCENDSHPDYYMKCNDYTSGCRCPVCSNKKIIKGINDIATTHSYLIKYFADVEDSYKYSESSGKKVKTICPDCNNLKTTVIYSLTTNGFKCNKCSDGISYPNKFITSLLNQKNIYFITEKKFKWSDNKIYDHYIESLVCIIENHGMQHYEKGFSNVKKRTVRDEQENDTYKEKLAKENGIRQYISLDCRRSELEWIKKSIMNSELPKLLNFKEEDIDWLKCHEFACSSRLKAVCDLWNSGKFLNVEQLSKHIQLSKGVIYSYLKKGNKINLCDCKI